MTFTFPLLLGGLLLIGIPVALHLLLRQKPKTVLFPAFRFLVKRHRTNLTKLRLRHILLMAMRVLLLAAIVLALAQPKVKDNPWSLPSDQAVAAVFIFDTSASMEYTVAANQSRLKDAQKRAVEMLKLLPENSEVVILDSADSLPIGKGDWLQRDKAAERIGQLTLHSANATVSARVAAALDLLTRIAVTKDDSQRGQRARVVCIFSDRTVASWDVRERKSLQELANHVLPTFDRLSSVYSGISEQEKLLAELPQRLATVIQSFPVEGLTGALQNLKERLPSLRAEDYPDKGTQPLLAAVRGKQQELLAILEQQSKSVPENAKEYHTKLTTALQTSLRNSAGFTAFYVDVGVEQPRDGALTDFQLLLESPVNGNSEAQFKLRADIQATGEDFRSTLACDATASPHDVTLDVKAGKREHVHFDLDKSKLKLGHHQVKVIATPGDQLPINNARYLTFAFRNVLVLADSPSDVQVQTWARAIEANHFGAARYRCEIKTPTSLGEKAPGMFNKYAAVFLCALKEPDDKLWNALADYAGKGGGIGVIPPAQESNKDRYNGKAAQEVLPATLDKIVDAKAPGVDWGWKGDIYKHPLLHPFQEWRLGKWDFVEYPRAATLYWQTEPRKEQVQVLVRYADAINHPALVEQVVEKKRGRAGRVLLFTTLPGWPIWNNYLENSFYVALVGRTIGYLSGDDDRPALNFISDQSVPRVPMPISGQAMAYKLYRDGAAPPAAFVAAVTVEEGQNEARIPQAAEPGNYTLRAGDTDPVAWFSVNLPPEESDLTKVPKMEIEAVLGPDAVLTIEGRTDLKEVMRGHVSRPVELMPILMLVLLVLLALENLLANKFYRRETQQV